MSIVSGCHLSGVYCLVDEAIDQAQVVASRLNLPLYSVSPAMLPRESVYALLVDGSGLKLQALGKGAPGPVWCDFAGGSSGHRRHFGGGKGQSIAKAVGLNKRSGLSVVDATAGLGRDAFVLACLGCEVLMLERNPVVAELLLDGLRRARQAADDPELMNIVHRMTFSAADSVQTLRSLASEEKTVDVVYLDPMFPERTKSARVKKEMAAFHEMVGSDDDAMALLQPALNAARYRVVVKRPRKSPWLGERKPTYQLEGKSNRFDIYVNASLDQAD